MDILLSWTIIVIVLLYVLYRFSTRGFGVFKNVGIKGPRPWPLVGTMIPFLRSGMTVYDIDMKQRYGSIVGTFFGSRPMLLVYDLDIIKTVMVKDFGNFQNRVLLGSFRYPFDNMMTVLKGDRWKHVRNTVTPTFSSGKLRKMQLQMEKSADTLVENLRKKADDNETVDFGEYGGTYTMDIIASTAFGLEIDSHNDPKNKFVRHSTELMKFQLGSFKAVVLLFLPFLIKPLLKLGYSLFPKDATDFFVQAVDMAMEQRRQETAEKNKVDFLQLMVNAEINQKDDENDNEDEDGANAKSVDLKNASGHSKPGLTHGEVLGQSILFLLAGHSTTANTLAFIAYLLAVNPDCQEKVVTEIEEVLNGQDNVSFDLINKMSYLDTCVSETLRLYPAAQRVDRVAEEQTTINGVVIPKDVAVVIPIYAIHHDPELWPDPEKFDPDRCTILKTLLAYSQPVAFTTAKFLPEAKASRNPYSYLPFGTGPRNCIGMRLALFEMKVAIVYILRQFEIVVCSETQIPLKLDKLQMQGEQGIKLRVKRRVAKS